MMLFRFCFVLLAGCLTAQDVHYSESLDTLADTPSAILLLEESEGTQGIRDLMLNVSDAGERVFLEYTGNLPDFCFTGSARIFSSDNLVNSSLSYKNASIPSQRLIHLDLGETYVVIKDTEEWVSNEGLSVISEWWVSQICPMTIEDALGREYSTLDLDHLIDDIIHQVESKI